MITRIGHCCLLFIAVFIIIIAYLLYQVSDELLKRRLLFSSLRTTGCSGISDDFPDEGEASRGAASGAHRLPSGRSSASIVHVPADKTGVRRRGDPRKRRDPPQASSQGSKSSAYFSSLRLQRTSHRYSDGA